MKREWEVVRAAARAARERPLRDEDEAKTLFPPVWAALRRNRPGVSRARSRGGRAGLRTSPEQAATPKRFVALDLDGETQGYAVYKSNPGFEGGVSTAKLDVIEAVGATPQALAEVWRFLLDVDWMDTINGYFSRPTIRSSCCSRIRAAPATGGETASGCGSSTSARRSPAGRISAGGSVVFEVRDAFCPWNEGRWKLEGGTASRTDDAAEIALDVDALGSAYLGASRSGAAGGAADRGARRGRRGPRGRDLRWRPLPWCPEIF